MNIKIISAALCFCLFFYCSICLTFAGPKYSVANLESDTLYYLIAGSYRTLASAKTASKHYLDQGLTPEILFPHDSKRFYRLSISQATQRFQLEKTAQNLQQLYPDLQTWIFTKIDEHTSRSVPSISTQTEISGSQFFLIISSYLEYDAAYEQASTLAEQGYEPMILLPSPTEERFRVSVYRTFHKPEIEAYSAMLKRQGRYPGWILQTDPQQEVLAYSTALNAELQQPQYSRFHLIAASFTDQRSALNYIQQMLDMGLEAYLLAPQPEAKGKRLYRVSLSQSENRSQLETYAQTLRSDPTRGQLFKGGLWILTR